MADRPFVHLHCHTHYSLLDGASRIPELTARVKELGMNAVAMTDHGNLYGAIEFYRECTAAGLNPIIGYEAYVAPGKRTEREARRRGDAGYHLTLLAKDLTGFKNLIKMSSIAYLEGYHYVPRIDKELLEAHSAGLICLSGCASSEFSEFILKDQLEEARNVARWFHQVFGDNFYVEIQNNGLDIQRQCALGAIEVANRLGLPLVATSDAHYLTENDAPAHEVLLCINTGKTLSDESRMRYGSNQFYVRPPEEMYKLFPEHAAAVKRSQEIADGIHIELDFKKRHFPVFVPPAGKTPEEYLRELCEEGLRYRYGENPSEAVRARLEHELGIICRMGFASYFLIVSDFVRFAVEKGIPCGARGSGCGALVSYLLKLSHVDPLEYDLLFERFLDPSRSEAPDIDIDFCQDRRDEVIAYVRQKYGDASVAQIATFGTMAARAAIKDVGRVLAFPIEQVNLLTKMIPERLGITIGDALAENPDLRRLYEDDPKVHQLLDIARKLEGTNRQTGIHAAGVVIANGPLTDYVPLHRAVRKGDDGSRSGEAVVATQWVMGDLEKVGLLKMDFLGLRTLTLLDNAVKLIEKTRGKKIDLYGLPLDDPETYALLQRGDAKGVFQLESDGIRELLKRMRPDNIRDIIAIMALYRPGPLEGGMVDDYVNIKHGRAKPGYAHPVLEEVLAETYGVMCIHEDVLVSLADGSERPIKNIRLGDRVHSLNRESRVFEVKECHGCGPTRRCDGIRLALENGFSVTLTEDHEVLTYAGMKQAQDLDPARDLLAVALFLPQEEPRRPGLAPWLATDEDVAYLFGHLVGDGCLTGTGITIATGEEANHDRLAAWLTEHLPALHLHPYYHRRSWYLTLSCPELLNEPGHGNRKTRLHHLLSTHALKCRADVKQVPEAIFRSPSSVRAAFLAGLIDSDGCLSETDKGAGVAFITSASRPLLEGVRRLCQLEGIAVQLNAGRAQMWNLVRLHQLVKPWLVLKRFVGSLPEGATTGWVPREALLAAIPAGESQRAFCGRTGIERRGLRNRYPFVKSSTAAKAGLDPGQVRYFQICSVTRVHDQQFYGLSVADHHNLVANGIVVKNCYQEQIMRILNRLGGIELASAYACIKAISKKKHEIIEARRIDFVKGAEERGLARETAEEIFELINKFGGYGFNKCLVGSTAVVDAVTGERTTVGSLLAGRRPFTVHALGEDGRLRPRAVTDVVSNGRRPVFELRTAQGKRVTATDNHPFRTLDGWTMLRNLKVGDRIAAPRRLRVEGGESWPEHEIITLAGLLSEGNACHPTWLDFPKATEKRVPEPVFRLCDTDLELFIGRLWAGDGFIANADQSVPFYATSSEGLARDLQTLLLRLGILSGVHARKFKYRGEERPGYTVHLLGEDSIQTFVDCILPHALGRESAGAHLRAHLQETGRGLVSKDTVPPEVRAWVDEERRKPGLTWKDLERRSQVSTQDFLAKGRPRKKGFRRSTLARLATFFDSTRLTQIATSDVFWDRVVAIEPRGEEETYDLTVDVDHNFVADGLIVHNSHTAAYAQLGYQTAYLKAHYRPEFMAALLSSEIEDGNKRDIMVDHIADARRLGVEVVPPSINASDSDFTVHNGKIVFGLTAIKGCGRAATDEVVRARNEWGPFKDLFDFCERVDHKLVNRAAMERLIKAGALDCLGGHRAQLMHLLPRALQAATERQNDRKMGQRSLFDAFGEDGASAPAPAAEEALPDVAPWPDPEKLKYEKEVLDFYLSSHPLAQRDREIRRYATHTVDQLKALPAEQEVTLGAMLTQVRVMTYKKPQRNGNTRYGRCKVEDFTGAVESVLWGDEFVKFKDAFREDEVVVVRGLLEKKTDEPSLQITRLLTLEQAQRELARELHLLVKVGQHGPVDVDALAELLRRAPGPCPVVLTVKDPGGRRCILRLGRDYAINPATYPREELEDLLGSGSVRLQ